MDFYYYSSEKNRDSIPNDEYFSPNYREGNKYEKNIILSNYFISQCILEIYKNKKKDNTIEISSFFYLPDKIKLSLKAENQILEDIFSGASSGILENHFEHHAYDRLLNYSTYDGFLLMLYMLDNGLDVDLLEDNHSMPYLLDEAIQYGKNLVSEIEFKKYFKNLEYTKIEELTKEEEKFYFNICASFFHFEFKDTKNREYEDLSSGEKNLYGQLINIYYYNVKYDNQELIFLFDEPEITLHPNWQRHYIKELYLIARNLNKRMTFLIASHSPYILSDLQKENVIFLKDGEQVDVDINPFGANIHTLLSHGFFMDGGLMGEFAKGKITAIKDFYDDVKKSKNPKNEHKQEFENNIENFKHIQSIIGEPFLKTIMKNYLDELELLFSDGEALINKELEALEKRKLYLEKLKNAKN